MDVNRKRIYLSPPHMGGMEQNYVAEAFTSNWIAPLGPNVDGFEEEISQYVGTRGAVALSSGTAAIHLALRLLDVGAGDTVFCSSLTFVASANPILYLGAIPVFIDSEPTSWNMSAAALERALKDAAKANKLPKAIVVVNLYGQSADMNPIVALAEQYQVPIIEDAAESLGATYKGKASGTFGKFGVYSFNGNKIITTSGGGMLVSDDVQALEKARFWATQSRDQALHYQHSEVGYNYRMSNVLAGIGRGQLKVLDKFVDRRRAIYDRYYEAFSEIPGFEFMPELELGRSTRWLTALTINEEVCGVSSLALIAELARHNIESRPVWKPLHLQPLFRSYRYYSHEDNRSVSDSLFASGICLPSGSNLLEEEQLYIMECMMNCVSHVVQGTP